MSGQLYDPASPWVDGFDSTAGVPFVALGRWELADQWPPGKRSRTREAGGTLARPVLLVSVRVEDTSHRARRDGAKCRHPRKQPLRLTWACGDCGIQWPRIERIDR